MAKLKLGSIEDDKPVRVSIDLPAALHRDLLAYGQAIARESGGAPIEPQKLIGPMLQRFMASDRGFAGARRKLAHSIPGRRQG